MCRWLPTHVKLPFTLPRRAGCRAHAARAHGCMPLVPPCHPWVQLPHAMPPRVAQLPNAAGRAASAVPNCQLLLQLHPISPCRLHRSCSCRTARRCRFVMAAGRPHGGKAGAPANRGRHAPLHCPGIILAEAAAAKTASACAPRSTHPDMWSLQHASKPTAASPATTNEGLPAASGRCRARGRAGSASSGAAHTGHVEDKEMWSRAQHGCPPREREMCAPISKHACCSVCAAPFSGCRLPWWAGCTPTGFGWLLLQSHAVLPGLHGCTMRHGCATLHAALASIAPSRSGVAAHRSTAGQKLLLSSSCRLHACCLPPQLLLLCCAATPRCRWLPTRRCCAPLLLRTRPCCAHHNSRW